MSDKRLRTYEQIAEILRATLHAGMLADGTVLLEGQLAEIFGASRTPVRQALELLRSEGLLNLFEGRGLIVGDGAVPPIRTPLSAAHFKYGDTEVTQTRRLAEIFQRGRAHSHPQLRVRPVPGQRNGARAPLWRGKDDRT